MIIPIGDSPNPPGKPWMTYGLIAANALIFDLVQQFEHSGLPLELQRRILEQARALQGKLTQSFPDDPDLGRSASSALVAMGDVLAKAGDLDGAVLDLDHRAGDKGGDYG